MADPAPIRGRWTETEIGAMASRITRFGWPYVTNATPVVRQVIEEQDRLRPPVPDEAAIERGARVIGDERGEDMDSARWLVEEILRAVLETPGEQE